jgi:hypothetical protein
MPPAEPTVLGERLDYRVTIAVDHGPISASARPDRRDGIGVATGDHLGRRPGTRTRRSGRSTSAKRRTRPRPLTHRALARRRSQKPRPVHRAPTPPRPPPGRARSRRPALAPLDRCHQKRERPRPETVSATAGRLFITMNVTATRADRPGHLDHHEAHDRHGETATRSPHEVMGHGDGHSEMSMAAVVSDMRRRFPWGRRCFRCRSCCGHGSVARVRFGTSPSYKLSFPAAPAMVESHGR